MRYKLPAGTRCAALRDSLGIETTVRILLVNDDGIHAPGLRALERP